MNAPFRTTAQDLANALSGRKVQTVHIVKTTFSNPRSPKYLVLVNNEYYEVYTHGLRALQSGVTPEELELEPAEDEDDESDDPSMRRHIATFSRPSGY